MATSSVPANLKPSESLAHEPFSELQVERGIVVSVSGCSAPGRTRHVTLVAVAVRVVTVTVAV